MPKKLPSNTAEAAVKAMLNAATPLPQVPKHIRLRDCDKPFWEGIMRARAREEWTESDLVVAAQLARAQADIERESETLEAEGSVVENARGTQIMNPRHSVLEQLARRELALMRSLGITGSAANGDKRNLEKARKIQREAERARDELVEDDLLAS